MKNLFIISALIIASLFFATAKERKSAPVDTYTIVANFVDIETKKPIDVACYLCHQEGDHWVELREKAYSENGTVKFELPEKPVGHYIALYPTSVKEAVDSNGYIYMRGTIDYLPKFVGVDLPDSGNVYTMPVIELERCKDANEYYERSGEGWPYPIPQKLIDMEREQNILDSIAKCQNLRSE